MSEMKVVAVRSDGALLVALQNTFESPAAIVLDDEFMVTTRGSALARGTWQDATNETISQELRARIASELTK